MRKLFLAACICLTLSSSAYTQNDDSYPTLKQLRGDYRSVSVVAHVEIQNTEIADTLGGYHLYAVYCQVLEPFKGRLKRGQPLKFYMQAERGYDISKYRGGWIVFLNRSRNSLDHKLSLFALENSGVPYSKEIIARMRRIKSSIRKNKSR